MIDPQYDPKKNEGEIYSFWENGKFFQPSDTGKKTYSITLPPPNVTGNLHMGHALNLVIQDVLIRSKRMQGYRTVWVPGIDHAGIATQNVVEKELRKQNISRHQLGRDEFLKKVWEWKNKYGDIILNQIRRMGASCDWSRTRFTMDEGYAKAVQAAFVAYYNKGLVYRGKRVINWCTRCQTSLSDLEVENEEEKGKLWHIKYPTTKEGKDFVIVATTRPETMLGDTAVAVNPSDARYKNLIGKTVYLPLVNKEIPVIADDSVDKEFGTGMVKVTPFHDFTDYQMGVRHKLEMIEIMDQFGRLNKNVPPKYQGLKAAQAREIIVEDLKQLDLLVKIEDHVHQKPHCARCHTVIEPLPSEQWFIKMKPLAEAALASVKGGKVKFHPKNWEKLMFNWMENIQDWCISRQLWWGHQMPIWQCQENQEYFCTTEKPTKCPKCGNCEPKQVEDVFDTWFSSALWPFAVFGWPENTKDLQDFYPTSTLSTARDIINLWVSRMIYSGLEFTGQEPFKNVIIHATVLTKDGKRMSKSLGTGIDPIGLVDTYGADATRMGLAWQATDLQDIHFSEDAIIAGKKFANKVWNATRFAIMDIPESKTYNIKQKPIAITEADKEILEKLDVLIEATTENISKFSFGTAIRDIYEYFWHQFCDIYIEKSKEQIKNAKSEESKENTIKILLYVLKNSLALLHPFMPFVTEALYQKLPIENKAKALIVEKWPTVQIALLPTTLVPKTQEKAVKVAKKPVLKVLKAKKAVKKAVKKQVKKVVMGKAKTTKSAKKHAKKRK